MTIQHRRKRRDNSGVFALGRNIARASSNGAVAKSKVLGVAIGVLLVAITWMVYGQTLWYDFVNFDDDLYVYDAPAIKAGLTLKGIAVAFTQPHARNWHPLTTISHMADCQLYGLNAGGHHATNVALHTIAVLLLFGVLWRMTACLWKSAVVAALFAIHPLHVESVAWVSERKDVLSAVFFFLMLGAYVRYAAAPSVVRYVTIALFWAQGSCPSPCLLRHRLSFSCSTTGH